MPFETLILSIYCPVIPNGKIVEKETHGYPKTGNTEIGYAGAVGTNTLMRSELNSNLNMDDMIKMAL